MVQNGTLSHVILDCVYGLNHSEKDGMILKWYFNGKIIFQWIPPLKPKVRKKYCCCIHEYKRFFISCISPLSHSVFKQDLFVRDPWIHYTVGVFANIC